MIQTTGITPVQGIVLRQVSGTELFPYLDEFLVTMGTKFGYTFFMKVVLLDVYYVQKFESYYLNQQNSSYDSNNWNYSSSGNYSDSLTSNSISGILG